MIRRHAFTALAMAMLTAPACAVGLGPLAKEGLTDGPVKAFYLDLINPYPDMREFRAYAVGPNDEMPAADVQIIPDKVRLAGERNRRLIVLVRALDPGETRNVRVCAELQKQEGAIHARVCSKLSARRVALRGH